LKAGLTQHNWDHITGNLYRALDIADSVDEEVGYPVLVTAVLFHDIGVTEGEYSGHEERSVEIAKRELPEMGFSQEEVDEVVHCVETTGESSESETLEAKINSDADKLVKAGFASVFNFFRVQAELDKDLEDMVSNLSKYEKLKEQGFYTERAREVAGDGDFEERIEFLKEFRSSLESRPDFTAGEEDLFSGGAG
jgi:HD superfamily phosphodiesterase